MPWQVGGHGDSTWPLASRPYAATTDRLAGPHSTLGTRHSGLGEMGLCSNEEDCPVLESTVEVKAGHMNKFRSKSTAGKL